MLRLIAILLFISVSFKSLSQEFDPDSLFRETTNKYDTAAIDAFNELCWHFKYSDPDTALYFGSKGLEFALRVNYDFGQAKAFTNLSIVHWGQGRYDSAITKMLSAKEIFSKIGNKKGICSSLNNLGMLHQNLGDPSSAIPFLVEGIRLQEAMGSDIYLGALNTNLGSTYIMLEDYPEAKKYLLKGNYYKLQKNQATYVTDLNLGVAYQKLQKPDSALWYYFRSLVTTRKMESHYHLAQLYLNIGTIYAESGRYDKAILYYDSAEVEHKINGNDYEYVQLLVREIEVFRLTGEFQKAYDCGARGLTLAGKLDNDFLKKITYQELSKAAKYAGDFNLAVSYMEEYIQYNEKVFNLDKDKQMKEIIAKYETDKKDNEIRILKSEIEITELRKHQAQLIAWGGVVVILLVLIAGYLGFKRYRSKQEALAATERASQQRERVKAVLQAEEKERARIARELHDGLGQMLSTLRLYLSHLNGSLDLQKPISITDSIINEVRNTSHNLMPHVLMTNGLRLAIEQIGRTVNESGQLRLESELLFDEALLNKDMEFALFRIIQELVNNSIKYSSASILNISITNNPSELIVTVSDNGKGFDTHKLDMAKGIGWKNIRTRLESMDGELQLSSGPAGTLIRLQVPLTPRQISITA